MKKDTFNYVKIGRCYWNLQQNFLKLLWYRLRSADVLIAAELQTGKLLKLYLYKWKILKKRSILRIGIYGQLCFTVYGGYKIFDFYGKNVTRIFKDHIGLEEVNKEMNLASSAASLVCAPNIEKVNPEKRWYREEYLSGRVLLAESACDRNAVCNNFKRHAVPLLEEIISGGEPAVIELKKYLALKQDGLIKRDLQSPDIQEITEILEFTDNIVTLLNRQSDARVLIAFSHGDFSVKNIVVTDSGPRLLDWELAARRSILYDFYNYFFHILRTGQNRGNLSLAIHSCLQWLQNSLNSKQNNYAYDFMPFSQIYRWLYYFERMVSISGFRASIHPQKRIRNLRHNMQVFRTFEKIADTCL